MYAKLNLGMEAGWIRAFVLIAVAALLGNAQCYGTCGGSACGSAQAPSSSCHHQKSSHEDATPCRHQHSEFSGPEAGIAKINLAMSPLILPLLTADSSTVFTQPQLLSQPNTGSPPGSDFCSTISVLRI